MTERVRHFNNFDFVRLAAACAVIWGHAYPLLAMGMPPLVLGTTVSTFAVKVFFAISGYLVAASWISDPQPMRFAAKRALRILPALWVVVILSVCVLGPAVTTLPLEEYVSDPLIGKYLKNLKLDIHYYLPGVFSDNVYPGAVNGALWSLPAEAMMYLLVCAAGLAAGWSGRTFAGIWLVLAIAFLALNVSELTLRLDNFPKATLYATPVRAMIEVCPYFLVGGCLATLGWRLPRWPKATTAVIVLAMIVTATTDLTPMLEPVLIVIVTYAVILFGSASTPVLRRFGRFGDLSYGTYLYGFPVAQTLSWAFGSNWSLWQHILATLALSLLFALLSWHLVEKPALRLKPGRKPSPSVARQAL